MFEFKNLSVNFDNGVQALIDFNLKIDQGEIVAIVGESGSGKTTAIRSAIGLLPVGGKIAEGDILLNDKSIKNLSIKEWQEIRSKEISMIFQDSGAMLNPIRTIGSQFVEYILSHTPMKKAEAWQKARGMLEETGLYDGEAVMKSIPAQLSGGMRQRVGIAMAMVFEPKILIADEPTSALDVTIQAQIVKQMMELRKNHNTAILMVTHNLGVAAYMADRIVVMNEGRIVEVGSKADIIENPQDEYTKKLLKAVPNMEGKRYV